MLHSAFRSGLLNQLPKLSAKDISAAVIYALATPPSVQVSGWVDLMGVVDRADYNPCDWKFVRR